MQSCLESKGIQERNIEIVKNCYQKNKFIDNGVGPENYSVSHPNALSNGDVKGKGTNHGGHMTFAPSQTKQKNVIDYSNFDTLNGGGKIDVDMRQNSFHLNLFDKNHPYGYDIVKKDETRK